VKIPPSWCQKLIREINFDLIISSYILIN